MRETLADPPVIRPLPPVIRMFDHLFRPPVIGSESSNFNRLVLIFFRLARGCARALRQGTLLRRAATRAAFPRRRPDRCVEDGASMPCATRRAWARGGAAICIAANGFPHRPAVEHLPLRLGGERLAPISVGGADRLRFPA